MAPSVPNISRPPHMHYVSSPIETVNKMNKLLLDYEKTPMIMDTVLREIGLNSRSVNDSEAMERIGEYLVEHEKYMKKLFMEGNPQEKNEIMRIYKKYIPHHTGF